MLSITGGILVYFKSSIRVVFREAKTKSYQTFNHGDLYREVLPTMIFTGDIGLIVFCK